MDAMEPHTVEVDYAGSACGRPSNGCRCCCVTAALASRSRIAHRAPLRAGAVLHVMQD